MQIGPGETARVEQGQRKHRSRRTGFNNEKANQQRDSCDPSHRNRFNQREDNSPETGGCQHNTGPVESGRGVSGTRLRDAPDRDREDDEGKREIDEEDPAPRQVLNEPSPKHRTECGGHRGEPGPRPYRSTSLCLRKRRTDERQTARHEQRGAHALHGASRDELTNRVGKAAPRGRRGEDEHAASKDLRRPRRSPNDPPVRSSAASVSA